MKTEPEIYEDYCRWCESIGIPPASFESWAKVGVFVSQQELKRVQADEFLASIHPDGTNLAGLLTKAKAHPLHQFPSLHSDQIVKDSKDGQ